jgi:hypothetical protein
MFLCAHFDVFRPTALVLLIVCCAPREGNVQRSEQRYRLELLARELDPELVRESGGVDLDGDGVLDRIVENDTSVHVVLSSGDEFLYTLGEMAEDSATSVEVGRSFRSIATVLIPH